MLRKASFWIPLVIAVALAVVLAFVVDDSFGKNIATYVQAVSTLVLVAVTTSYVIATYGIAQISAEQLTLDKSQRGIDAVTELWTEFSKTQMIAGLVIADARTMQRFAKKNVNHFAAFSAAADARRDQLASFSHAFNRLSLHIPEAPIEPGTRLIKAYKDADLVGRYLSDEIHREITKTSAEGTGFEAKKFGEYWDSLSEDLYDGLPAWDNFDLRPQQENLAAATSAFSAAAREYVKMGS